MLVTANSLVSGRATDMRNDLNAGSVLRLYQNTYTPAPDMVAGDFTEATYSGYGAVTLTGTWAAPVKDAEGQYSTTTGSHDFTHNGGATDNTIRGMYITNLAGAPVSAMEFAQPIEMENGSLPFRLQPKVTVVDQSTITP